MDRHHYHQCTLQQAAHFLAGDYIAQPKVDGVWVCAMYYGGSHVSIYGRRDKQIATIPVDPVPGLRFVCVGEYRNGALFLFDCVSYDGIDIEDFPYYLRDDSAGHAADRLGSPRVVHLPHTSDVNELWTFTKDRADMYDGIVCKHIDAPYNHEDYPHQKVKHSVTIDYVVLGATFTGKGKQCAGRANGFRCGLYKGGKLEQVCIVPNVAHRYRDAMTDNPDAYTGRVIEARGQRVFPSGALRHPVFVRFRPDKPEAECTHHAV